MPYVCLKSHVIKDYCVNDIKLILTFLWLITRSFLTILNDACWLIKIFDICLHCILLCQFVMKRLSKHSNLNDKSINQSINQSVIFKMKHIRGFYLYHYYMTVLLCYLQRTNSIQFLTLNFYFFFTFGVGLFLYKKNY